VTRTATNRQVAVALDTLLEKLFWPASLRPEVGYARTHDDCEGDPSQTLEVYVTADGDAHLVATAFQSLRFRHGLGGGLSPRTRNALLVLAEAIRRDNEAQTLPRQSLPAADEH
jgi:hypothetical protein